MVLQLSTCTVDLARLAVVAPAGESRLTTREAELLAYLASHPSQAITRDELLREVWGYADNVVSRAADNTVRRLREKVEADPAHPVHIVTVFGTGYRFEPTVAPVAASVPTATAPDAGVVQLGDRAIDLRRQRIEVRGEARPLTAVESSVLAYLIAHPGRAVTRRELLRKVWNRASGSGSRAVDSAMARLRAKLEDDPADPQHLLTVRGVGYRFAFGLDRGDAPLGEVALAGAALFGEAALWRSDPDLATEVVSAVADLFRGLTDRHDGYLWRQDGGAFRLAFASPVRALRFCLEAQERLMDLPLTGAPSLEPLQASDGTVLFRGPRMRMAVHTGTPVAAIDATTGRTEYRGPAADHLAALLDQAEPGQVLVTATAWSGLPDDAQRLAKFEPLGEQLPTGPPRDRQVVSAVPVALGGRVFATTRRGGLHGVPPEPSPFFGRSEEIEAIGGLVNAPGVVILLGPPGIGKTRLAARVATTQPFPGGVWWVSLAPARSRTDVARAVANGVGVLLDEAGDPIAVLERALSRRGRALVVLDNYEQVADVAGDVPGRLAAAAPELSLVVTSRIRLGGAGERVFEVEAIARGPAVALFNHRASQARTAFDPSRHAGVIGRIVDRLDRMPLAVELAAARIGLMSAEQLLARLGDRITPTAALDAAIAWSWGLLATWEQATLAQLSVFRGGFTLDAAEELVDLSAWPEAPDTVDVIQGLRDHSLLRSWDDPHQAGVVRLGPFESIREFAAARRRESPRADAESRRRFVTMYARYGSIKHQRVLATHGGTEGLRVLASEIDNLVTATDHAFEVGSPADAARCTLAAVRVFEVRAPFQTAVEMGERALALPDVPVPLRAWLSYWVAHALRAYDQYERAEAHVETAVASGRACGDLKVVARAEVVRAETLMDRFRWPEAREVYAGAADIALEAGDQAYHLFASAKVHRSTPGELGQAERLYRQALHHAELQGDAVLASTVRANLARVAAISGRLRDALALYDEALVDLRALGDLHWELRTVQHKAGLLVELGHLEENIALRHKALTVAHSSGRLAEEAQAFMELAHAYRLAGEPDRAWQQLQAAAPLVPSILDMHLVAYHEVRTCEVALDLGDLRSARHHVDRAVELWSGTGNPWPHAYVQCLLAKIQSRQGEHDEALDNATQAVATLREFGVPTDEGLALARLGLVHVARGELEPAREALAAAEALQHSTGAGDRSELGQEIQALREVL